ncbi:MAG: AAA family ATPase [Armatimonadota bacterium]
MLVQFSVRNYRSIKETAILSMVAEDSNTMISHFASDASGRYKLLKSAAIYGANASGKTNVLKAIAAMKSIVCSTHSNQPGSLIEAVVPFSLDARLESSPTEFEMVFIIDDQLFSYGLVADRHIIHHEYLKSADLTQKRITFKRQFDRNRQSNGEYTQTLGKSWSKRTASECLENQLFISKSSQNRHAIAGSIFQWFSRIQVLVDNDFLPIHTISACIEDAQIRKTVSQLMSLADPGISGFNESVKPVEASGIWDNMPDALRALFVSQNMSAQLVYELSIGHRIPGTETVKNFNFEEDESHGTKRLFSMAGPLLTAIKQHTVILCDEFDSSLHPLLAQALLELIHSDYNAASQVVMTTHNTGLIRFFTKDQVWFTDKDDQLATSLYSLQEFRDVSRSDVSKAYLLGRYGALPFIDNLSMSLPLSEEAS